MRVIFRNFLIIIIKIYQILLSPILPPSCKYYPSCSQYMIEAIVEYGIIKGIMKGIYRILRCNPFSRGGYDPVLNGEERWKNIKS